MQNLRVKLYLLLAGLLDLPEEVCANFHFSLIAKLLQDAPSDWPLRPALEALEREIVEDASNAAELHNEYVRLFGDEQETGMVATTASAWLDKAAGSAARDARSAHGMPGDEAGDIIGELEFMAYLIADDQASRPIQRDFLESYLARWTPYFAQAVRFAARLPRYRLTAELLEQAITADLQYLRRELQPAVLTEHLRVA
jgi:TorA maturation chaperone TorD